MPLTKIPQSMVEGFNTPTSYPADRTELANINGVLQPSAYLRETGREGVFKWVGTNQSANITADPNQGVYVPPASDLTGTSGAWVRTIDSAIQTKWFGTNGWQAAINLAATLGILTVIASGVHTLTSGSLQMRPSITLRGLPGARVTQANGANITHIVDMATFTANSCKLESLTIDGNWSNNNKPTNNSNSLVLLWDSNNVTIKDCSLISSTGNGIIIRNATRYLIEHNAINGVFIQGITVVRDIFNIPSYGKIINNEITSHGQLGIVVAYSDNVDIIGNVVNSSLVRTGLNVNTSGTTVTSVSGPFFTPDMVGRFIVLGGGFEFLITGFTSSTQLTVSPSAGSNTNTPAAIGQGDNFSIQGCNYVNVEGNISQSGITPNCLIHLFTSRRIISAEYSLSNASCTRLSISIASFLGRPAPRLPQPRSASHLAACMLVSACSSIISTPVAASLSSSSVRHSSTWRLSIAFSQILCQCFHPSR